MSTPEGLNDSRISGGWRASAVGDTACLSIDETPESNDKVFQLWISSFDTSDPGATSNGDSANDRTIRHHG